MLKQLRLKKRRNISELARAIGVDRGTYKRLERGETQLRVEWVPVLANLLDVSKEELFQKYLKEKEVI